MSTPQETLQDTYTTNAFNFQPFGTILQPVIQQAVTACGLEIVRKGTKLSSIFVMWVVLMSTIRRDLNGHRLINWMLSGFRWVEGWLPASSTLVSDGALSHARERVGVDVFRRLFVLLRGQHQVLQPDFHGHITGAFDGGTGTMPDTPSNRAAWGKPGSSRSTTAFPQMRFMSLLLVATRTLWDAEYAPYRGKHTGERALLRTIVDRLGDLVLLLLLDAGLYSFEIVWTLHHLGHDVIVKVPKTVKFPVVKRLSDGSFLSQIQDSLEAPDGASPTGRRQWIMQTLTVRVIRGQMRGYRPWTLVTTLLDPAISAREIAQQYHRRWDIEIAYDEIKTHQCATLRGHSPTTFRSKRGDFVEQEFYAMVIMDTTIRLIMAQAAHTTGVEPRALSFLDSLQHLVDAAPFFTLHDEARQVIAFAYLLDVIASTVLDRPRRPRLFPRVIKVARSKFPRKRETDLGSIRDLEKTLTILVEQGDIPS